MESGIKTFMLESPAAKEAGKVISKYWKRYKEEKRRKARVLEERNHDDIRRKYK